jgi:hypothetical protein
MSLSYKITENNEQEYLIKSINEQKYQVTKNNGSGYLVNTIDLNVIYVGPEREYTSLYDAVLESTDGTLIIIDEGEYIEEAQIEIPVGVSLTGFGDVIVKTNYEAVDSEDAFLLLKSDATGEDGSQEISNIIFDGDFNGGICALVWCRNKVIFQNCTIRNFTHQGIQYKTVTGGMEPTYYATGNIVRNCVFRDCSRRTAYGQGAINCSGQSGLKVYGNSFYLEDRPAGQNGNIMMLSWIHGFEYYDNVSWKVIDEGADVWNMGIEVQNSIGGNVIYNNVFNGGGRVVDIAGSSNTKGDYTYSWWIHHNEFKVSAQQPAPSSNKNNSEAINFESTCRDAIVSYNTIVNLGKAFVIDQAADVPQITDNIKFYYNLAENIGYTDETWGAFLTMISYRATDLLENIFVYNNVYKGYNSNSGIRIVCYGTSKNIYIYNNIIEGVRVYQVQGTMYGWLNFENGNVGGEPVEVASVFIRNNILYDNVNNNAIYYWPGITVDNLVEADTINDSPEYVSAYTDFHLTSNSPAIDAGIDVDLDFDLDGEAVGDPPCIGIYEYVN